MPVSKVTVKIPMKVAVKAPTFRIKSSLLMTLMAFFTLIPLQGDAEIVQSKIKTIRALLASYRQNSDRIQVAGESQKIWYCVYNEYDPRRKTKLRIGWQTADGARNFVAGQHHIDQIIVSSQGKLTKNEGIPVGTAMVNIFHGLVPLDTDTYRVLRQTREYDKRNRIKFENFAGGLEKIVVDLGPSSALRAQAQGRLKRLAGTYGFGGMEQTVGYVQRDFSDEFNGKKMMNFGKCEGASALVIEIAKAIRAEWEIVSRLTVLLNELANDLESESADLR